MMRDVKDSVIDAKTNTPMLVEMAHKLRDELVLGREPSSQPGHEPSSQPSVLVTPEQRPHIERHIFSASSVATSFPIFTVTQDWYVTPEQLLHKILGMSHLNNAPTSSDTFSQLPLLLQVSQSSSVATSLPIFTVTQDWYDLPIFTVTQDWYDLVTKQV
jgi:hypothetical protein